MLPGMMPLAILFFVVGGAAILGGITGSSLLVAMFGGLRGRAPNTAVTRAGMVVGGVLVVLMGALAATGRVGIAGTP